MLNIYTNALSYRHDTGFGHPESARRIDAALDGVGRVGLRSLILADSALHPDTERMIARVHSAD